MTQRFICIHAHFYQPPRENPWLETVEIQDSAFPYHDWNERITAECYASNTASRKLDGQGRITGIINNYARISFNFGPTLLSWLDKCAPEVYRGILEADRQSMACRSGHGAALAQVYNHMIMPLASEHDKRTQVRWGIRDFERRFRRFPEGMWLAETAVDTATLEILAAEGVAFTILAPHQAARVRKLGSERWKDVTGARIDPSRPYLCRLPSGRIIAIFFYDGPISQAVAFEKLLDSGDQFASRLMSGFNDSRRQVQLVNIATDGETYGHHHRFGEMALGHTLTLIEEQGMARLTNYGEFLSLFPPTHEVCIIENSSWSCMHGIERWRNDCGCCSGGRPGWNQQWRAPLRKALDMLRDRLALLFEENTSPHLADPWQARDEYIDAILDRSKENVAAFLRRQTSRPLDENETTAVLSMLEMQRHAMLMYTSCGWFFDEISGIETVQILQYAGRAMQLAQRCGCVALEAAFLQELARAASNIPGLGNGADIYARTVTPAMVDLITVGAHYAVSALFEDHGGEMDIFCYRAAREDLRVMQSGSMKLVVGRIFIRSSITREANRISFCTLHFGGHSLNGGVRPFIGEEAYLEMKQQTMLAFSKGDIAAIIRLMDFHFGMHNYTLRHLFRDKQRHILQHLSSASLREFEGTFISLYDSNKGLMEFVRESGMPLPKKFSAAAEISLNLKLQMAFTTAAIDMENIREIVDDVRSWGILLDEVVLEFSIRKRLEKAMAMLLQKPLDPELLSVAIGLAELVRGLPISINLWQSQNLYRQVVHSAPIAERMNRQGDHTNNALKQRLTALGDLLACNVQALVAELQTSRRTGIACN